MRFLLNALTWWHDRTIGTALFTWRNGVKVGSDEQGNVYYKERQGERRWVIYNGEIEASRIPPEWHAWLHYLSAQPPSEKPMAVRPWEKPHQPNFTGTANAYVPPGSLMGTGHRSKVSADYEPWVPN